MCVGQGGFVKGNCNSTAFHVLACPSGIVSFDKSHSLALFIWLLEKLRLVGHLCVVRASITYVG